MLRFLKILIIVCSSGCASILGAPELRNEDECRDGDGSNVHDLNASLRNLPTNNWIELRTIDEQSHELLAVGVLDPATSPRSHMQFTNVFAAQLPIAVQLFVNYDSDRAFDPQADVALQRSVCSDGRVFLSSDSEAPTIESLAQGSKEEFRASFVVSDSALDQAWEVRVIEASGGITRGIYRIANLSNVNTIISIPGIIDVQTSYRIEVALSPSANFDDLLAPTYTQTQSYEGSNEVVVVDLK